MRFKTNEVSISEHSSQIAAILLIHVIITVESSDKVSHLLIMEFNHYKHERCLLEFQRNTVFDTLNDQSKSNLIAV